MKNIIITYAWAIGCWKSPITNYISTKLWLPTFNTDTIRSEVCEDYLKFDEDEARKRIKERLNDVIQNGISFICDASVDRKRKNLIKEILIKNNYEYFIVSIDLNKETLSRFYKAKLYSDSMKMIDRVYEDHQKFLEEYSDDINLHINEDNYNERLEIVYKAISQRMKDIEKH